MKDQIQKVIEQYVYAVSCNMEVYTDLGGQSLAAAEIEQLMCYREVRAIVKSMDGNMMTSEDIRELCIEIMIYDYPESMITAAIERVKTESNE